MNLENRWVVFLKLTGQFWQGGELEMMENIWENGGIMMFHQDWGMLDPQKKW